jgi:ABC-2 type transport system ATP-binding protein
MRESDIEQIGYLPEERGLYKKMKVGEQALYLARLKGLSTAQATKELKEWFVKFGIQAWWNKKVEELSKGMAQKIQFVTTVLHRPKLLILDEPVSGVDIKGSEKFYEVIKNLKTNYHIAIAMVSHDLGIVKEYADNVILINKSVLKSGSAEEVFSSKEFKESFFYGLE